MWGPCLFFAGGVVVSWAGKGLVERRLNRVYGPLLLRPRWSVLSTVVSVEPQSEEFRVP